MKPPSLGVGRGIVYFSGKHPLRLAGALWVLAAWCILLPAAAQAQVASAEAEVDEAGRDLDALLMEEAHELQRLRKAAGKLPAPRLALPPNLARPAHVMLLFVDHWEPSDYSGSYDYYSPEWEAESGRLADYWLNDYARMTAKHRDADGRTPQHTWFTYQLGKTALDRIAKAAFLRLGEVEVHMHHGDRDDANDDNRTQFIELMRKQIDALQGRGALLSAAPYPDTHFGFIHGNWGLDNSSGQYCGVRNELHLLKALGCYGDFTFPSGYPTQPDWTNKIFASKDNFTQPKSYSDPSLIRELAAGEPAPGVDELMIFEGPGQSGAWCNIDEVFAPGLEPMDQWVNEYVHVPGRDDWVFVKIFTHGAQTLYSGAAGVAHLVGEKADQFYADIERVYNDGKNFKLHYVTAREAYNIVRAAIDGKSGDPSAYRDYVIPRPANTHIYVNQPYRLLSFDARKRKINFTLQAASAPLEFWLRDIRPPCLILESSTYKEWGYHVSDAVTTSTAARPLVVRDATPSLFYRIVQDLPNASPRWRAYR